MSCLDADALAAVFTDELGDDARAAIDAHVDSCATCRHAIAALARSRRADADADLGPTPDARGGATTGTTGAARDPHVALAPGDTVGRYVVTGFLGAGAMGAVYGARDPQLDRPVALKLVAASPGAARARRLVREAQAMARLSHPNVIPIYDAGTSGDLVFIAMKQVDGVSLRAHLAAARRDPREVVRLLRGAGAGLAAAHAAGIVHRDLKPDNILVERDGVAQVGDFGLAAIRDELAAAEADATPVAAAGGADADWRTADGTLLGTPAYMAPEVRRGEPADARSDQYSFGVTLAEAAGGTRPGEAPSAALPRRIRAVIERATADDPAHRFASMDALLDRLSPRPGARTGAIAVGALGVVVAAVAIAWPRGAAPAGTAAACDHAAAGRLAEVWNTASRDATTGHLAGLAAPGAAPIAAAVVGRIDRYASAWLAARRDACQATRVRGEQTAALLDLRITCLDERLDELAVVARALDGLDAGHVDRAPRLADVLGDLGQCADAGALLGRAAPDDATGQARSLRGELAAVRALVPLGGYDEALRRIDVVVTAATAARLPVVEAEALMTRAAVRGQARRPGVADDFHAALAIGEHRGDAAVRADALIGLIADAAGDQARASEVELLSRMIDAVFAELPGEQRLRRARLAANLGNFHVARHDLAAAAGKTEEAIAGFAAELGASHPFTLMARQNLHRVLIQDGKYDAALASEDRLLADIRTAYGDAHPLVVNELVTRGVTLAQAGRTADARVQLEDAVALAETVFGPDHVDLADVLRRLGYVLLDGDDPAAARPVFARAIAIFERTSAQHPDLAPLLVGLGQAELAAGDAAGATRTLERALAAWGDSQLNAHLLPAARYALAQALWASGGDRRRARELATRAREEFIANQGPWQVRATEVAAWLKTHR